MDECLTVATSASTAWIRFGLLLAIHTLKFWLGSVAPTTYTIMLETGCWLVLV